MKKWLLTLQKDENIFNYLATKEIGWKFNMSCAPWWGGFFERLIGMMKSALSKAIGQALNERQRRNDQTAKIFEDLPR